MFEEAGAVFRFSASATGRFLSFGWAFLLEDYLRDGNKARASTYLGHRFAFLNRLVYGDPYL